ncbi:hypothetical protein D3C86_2250370 [compost metagenome]
MPLYKANLQLVESILSSAPDGGATKRIVRIVDEVYTTNLHRLKEVVHFPVRAIE